MLYVTLKLLWYEKSTKLWGASIRVRIGDKAFYIQYHEQANCVPQHRSCDIGLFVVRQGQEAMGLLDLRQPSLDLSLHRRGEPPIVPGFTVM